MSRSEPESNGEFAALPLLPPSWCWCELQAIACIAGGITKDQKRPRTSSTREVPYLRVANVQRGKFDLTEVKAILADEANIEALRLQRGDVLFTEGGDRDKLGRGWIWNEELPECIHQNHVFRARPKSVEISSKFVSYHGNTFGQEWFTKAGKQTTNLASINKSVLSRFPVPLAPANEQLRIVEKVEQLFSELDVGVAALERARANLKRYRASVLKAAVDGSLTAQWRAEHPDAQSASKLLERILGERRRKWESDQRAKFKAAGKEPPKHWRAKYVEPAPPNTATLPELPSSWCWTTLESVADVVGGLTKDRKRAHDRRCREVPYLRVANVQRGFLDLNEVKVIHATQPDVDALRLLPGDVLFTEGGDRDKLGRGWVWNGELDECVHQNHIFRARLYSKDIQPVLVSHHGNSFGKTWFTTAGKQTTNLASINLTILRKFPVPVVPIDEQSEIVELLSERLAGIAVAQKVIDAGLARAARLRQSILKQAFEGKLVEQNAADEPASAMLLRIKAQTDELDRQNGRTERKSAKGIRFRQGAVVSYVIDALGSNKDFGRTQLEKALHLTQSHLQVDLGLEFMREAAGPFDEVIYKIESLARKQGWFTTRGGKHGRATYEPGPHIAERCKAAVAILGEHRSDLDTLLGHFRKMNTEQAELFATTYAAWNDILLDGRTANDDSIIAEVRAWHESKKRFDEPRILKCIKWIQEHGYVPTGHGEHTLALKNPSKPKRRKA